MLEGIYPSSKRQSFFHDCQKASSKPHEQCANILFRYHLFNRQKQNSKESAKHNTYHSEIIRKYIQNQQSMKTMT